MTTEILVQPGIVTDLEDQVKQKLLEVVFAAYGQMMPLVCRDLAHLEEPTHFDLVELLEQRYEIVIPLVVHDDPEPEDNGEILHARTNTGNRLTVLL